ncbi:MAG: Glycine cleavage system transcriptional activator [Accumulibacter sp.]|uniref:LysR family transcriptional regulator n=1 Tax=Accumulibacter sp. TaxID=2053492 RepID=UPI00121257D4|nr:LysR family transcriptional regulator [Accumulibacter sp.]TLD46757.1 MAG: Glycine cleavage system transcriptional activator [Accumulibacter sp.]
MAFRLPPMQAREAFAAAARQQSFLKAADELCVTQSAISHRIKQLEDDLGVRPFLCLNRNIVLTPPGEAYLAGIRAALADIERAPPAIARGARRELRVSVAPAIGSRWLASRLADSQHQYPAVAPDSVHIDPARHHPLGRGRRRRPPWRRPVAWPARLQDVGRSAGDGVQSRLPGPRRWT